MRHLRIVGDGERDVATLPNLVSGILKAEFTHKTTPWPQRLHLREKKIRGYALRGYGLKLLYVLRHARSDGAEGVVACLDADTETKRQRLKQMKQAREAHRSISPPIPTALGEARPHNEAWLLDDPVAVREGLGLPAKHPIPNVQKCSSPKHKLEQLHAQSTRKDERPLEVWRYIATHVDEGRCPHKKKTGFGAFVAELRAEIAPLFGKAS